MRQLQACLLALATSLALPACAPPAVADARSSVILISIDTLRADHLGLYGYERDTTPFLDRFARECVVFEHAFTPWPWTLTAHMTMLTGLLPSEHGIVESNRALAPAIPTLAERLQQAGYHTVGLYYPGWIHERHGFARGFDEFRSHKDAEKAEEHLLETLDELDPARPSFLFLHLFDVHSARFEEPNRTVYEGRPPYVGEFLRPTPAPLPDVPARELWESERALTPEQLETLVAYYDSGIRHVDEVLARWFAEFERRGWLENTLVVITSDHGESLGQRGRIDGHGYMFQEGLHVPLLMRLPGAKRAGERCPTPAHLADIAPTILAAAGLAPEPSLTGRSLLEDVPGERWLSGSRSRAQAYLVQWPRKLVRNGREGCYEFDLEQDPREQRPRALAEKQFIELQRSLHGSRFPAPLEIDAMEAEDAADLQGLGYGGEVEPR